MALSVAMILVGCAKEEAAESSLLTDVSNPAADRNIAYTGETVNISFSAPGAWTAELLLNPDGEWAKIARVSGNDKAGKGSVRLNFDANESGAERAAKLTVTVGQHSQIFDFTQADKPEGSAMSEFLNTKMDEVLQEKYLWAEEYRGLNRDLTVNYSDFLYTHLSQLGETNIEDGGYYRAYSANKGKRYIYSYIQEVIQTKSLTKNGTLTDTYGLGIGPLFASPTGVDDNIYLTVGYVYRGSPAETAGLQKGDNIYAVAKGNGNPVTITRSNYQDYMKELFSSPSGSYTLMFARYDPPTEDNPGVYPLNPDYAVEVTASAYGYDPILYAAYLKKSDITTNSATENWPDFCIGYLALESFDMSAQFVLEDQLRQFKEAGINELILDFSFCVGGVVDQSCYLASSIVGASHYDDIFFTAEFNDGSKENWTFGGNNPNLPTGEKLGVGPDFGLEKVWIIVSENTASAAELIINALKSNTVNFPVTLIGSRTEGKNVGMEVMYIEYGSRRFEFAPITYWGLNADGAKGPADGFLPEGNNMLNNQNSSYSDDVVNIFPYTFGDWGSFDFNRPFYYIFCDIIGDPRPEDHFNTTPVKSMFGNSLPGCTPIASTGVNKTPGRCGTLIYRNN